MVIKKSILLAAVSLTLAASPALYAKKASRSRYYENPVVRATAPDPSVIRTDDGMFYMYATGKGYSIFKSRNMTDWEPAGNAFTDETYPKMVRNGRRGVCWAPEIRKIGGRYVLFYTLWFGKVWLSAIGYAVSDTPEGPFHDKGILIDSREVNVEQSIDQFYFEDNGKSYLFWGSFRDIYAVELKISENGDIAPDFSTKVKVAGRAFEGTNIWKRGKYYYFFASVGNYAGGEKSTYRTVVARAENVLGPYVNRKGVSILDDGYEDLLDRNASFSGPGHNAGLILDDAGKTWMYYHAYQIDNLALKRQGMLDEVKWTKDGWPYISGGTPSSRSKTPKVKL